jgi:hypothetical protein
MSLSEFKKNNFSSSRTFMFGRFLFLRNSKKQKIFFRATLPIV